MYLQAKVQRNDNKLEDIVLTWDGCVAIGYAGRDQEGVKKHIDELVNIGVTPPYAIPAMYWIEQERVTTTTAIQVVGKETSAEVEFFAAKDTKGAWYITVASDHTDRSLEVVSVSKSKQICPKIISPVFWALDDIAPYWDDLVLTCTAGQEKTLYQQGTLAQLLPFKELAALAEKDASGNFASVSFLSGTLPIIGGKFVYSDYYTISLENTALKRTLHHNYTVTQLADRS